MPSLSPISPSRLKSSLLGAVWGVDITALPRWQAWPLHLVRILYAVVRGLADGQLSLRAMSLVYWTLLSLVPLLAISFSVLKGFGVHNQIEPVLLGLLEPLGPKGVEITERVIGFVDNVKAGVLGSLGLGLLVYTVVSLMQRIERAFNHVWHVTRPRSFVQRFSDYVSIVVIGPLLVFSSVGITASVMSTRLVGSLTAIEPLGVLVEIAGRLVPYVLIVAAFAFINVFMPNTRVRLRSALVGALVAGLLWQVAGWVFASLIVVVSTEYTAIYTGFATLIVLMIWLYLGWFIMLVGASIAFHHQHPEFLGAGRQGLGLSPRVKGKLAVLMAFMIGERFYRYGAPWTAEGLAQTLAVPGEAVESVLQALEDAALLSRSADEPPAYLPRRPLETIAVKEVLDAVRAADEPTLVGLARLPCEPAVERILDRLDAAAEEALQGQTLKDLALSAPETAPAPRQEA